MKIKGFLAEITDEEVKEFLLYNTGARSYADDYIEIVELEDCKKIKLYQKNSVGVAMDICAVVIYEHGIFVEVPSNDIFTYDELQKELYRYFIEGRGPKFAEKLKSRMRKHLIVEANEASNALDEFGSSLAKCGTMKTNQIKKMKATLKEDVATAMVDLGKTLDEVLQEVEQQDKSL